MSNLKKHLSLRLSPRNVHHHRISLSSIIDSRPNGRVDVAINAAIIHNFETIRWFVVSEFGAPMAPLQCIYIRINYRQMRRSGERNGEQCAPSQHPWRLHAELTAASVASMQIPCSHWSGHPAVWLNSRSLHAKSNLHAPKIVNHQLCKPFFLRR